VYKCNMIVLLTVCVQMYKDKVPETLDPIVVIQQLTKALAVAVVSFILTYT